MGRLEGRGVGWVGVSLTEVCQCNSRSSQHTHGMVELDNVFCFLKRNSVDALRVREEAGLVVRLENIILGLITRLGRINRLVQRNVFQLFRFLSSNVLPVIQSVRTISLFC